MSDPNSLADIQSELSEILSSRLNALGAAVSDAESTTWRVLSSAVELDRSGQGADDSAADLERLRELHSSLQAVLEQTLSELQAALRDSEVVTRRILGAELEIERHRGAADALSGQADELAVSLERARGEVQTMREQYASVSAERETQRREMSDLRAQLKEAQEEASQARETLASTQQEHDALQKETDQLQIQQKALHDNVERMRQMRDDGMITMAGLTDELNMLSGGVGSDD